MAERFTGGYEDEEYDEPEDESDYTGLVEQAPKINHYTGETTVFRWDYLEGQLQGLSETITTNDDLAYLNRRIKFSTGEGNSDQKTIEVGYPAEDIDGEKRVGVYVGDHKGAHIAYNFNHPTMLECLAAYGPNGVIEKFGVTFQPPESEVPIFVQIIFDAEDPKRIKKSFVTKDYAYTAPAKLKRPFFFSKTASITPKLNQKRNEAALFILDLDREYGFEEVITVPRELEIDDLYTELNKNKHLYPTERPEPPIL